MTWAWHEASGTPVRAVVDVSDATLTATVRVTEQLHAIDPDDAAISHLHAAAVLEDAQRRVGYDQVMPQPPPAAARQALDAGPGVLIEVLDVARKQRFRGAAIALLDQLAKTGDSTLLRGTSGRVSSVAAALLDPDRRVRFAAARAIVALDPKEAYPGSSYLPDVLGYLASSGGRPRVLIGHPKTDIARLLAIQLATLGFEGDTVSTGRAFALRAFANPDYAFLLIDDAMTRPTQRELRQTLRRDPRTGELPIGLIVQDLDHYRGRAMVDSDPLSLVFALPLTATDMALETRRLLKIAGRQWLPPEQRMMEAIFAIETLARWAEESTTYGFYDVMAQQKRIIRSFNSQVLSVKAARLLGLLATPEAQLTLVQFASEPARPLAARRAAVAAFKQAVGRRHLLLTRAQVLAQYDRYNASENLDRDTQQVLAAILDVMEKQRHAATNAADKQQAPKRDHR